MYRISVHGHVEETNVYKLCRYIKYILCEYVLIYNKQPGQSQGHLLSRWDPSAIQDEHLEIKLINFTINTERYMAEERAFIFRFSGKPAPLTICT